MRSQIEKFLNWQKFVFLEKMKCFQKALIAIKMHIINVIDIASRCKIAQLLLKMPICISNWRKMRIFFWKKKCFHNALIAIKMHIINVIDIASRCKIAQLFIKMQICLSNWRKIGIWNLFKKCPKCAKFSYNRCKLAKWMLLEGANLRN